MHNDLLLAHLEHLQHQPALHPVLLRLLHSHSHAVGQNLPVKLKRLPVPQHGTCIKAASEVLKATSVPFRSGKAWAFRHATVCLQHPVLHPHPQPIFILSLTLLPLYPLPPRARRQEALRHTPADQGDPSEDRHPWVRSSPVLALAGLVHLQIDVLVSQTADPHTALVLLANTARVLLTFITRTSHSLLAHHAHHIFHHTQPPAYQQHSA